MCGIAGIVGEGFSSDTLNRMLEVMNHRGPDAKGLFVFDTGGVGHCRLSIVDLSPNANQPFVSDDKSVAVVVNGEIYNFLELRKVLESKGARFKSNSDSEVVLHGYVEYGQDFIKQLDGMFAVAVYDKKNRKIILTRDRLGIKPLYYHHGKSQFVFGSEIKAIAQCKAVDLETDFQALSEYLIFENCFSNKTLNRRIKQVLPGEIISIETSNLRLSRSLFWKPEFNYDLTYSESSLYEKYLSVVKKSVKQHLLSDVPIGAYLSSGFDSSTVAYWACNELGHQNISTYTGSFGREGFYNESRDAKRIAQGFKCSNKEIEITPVDFKENLERILWHLDEPKVGMGSFSQYMVAKEAAKDVKVILTGHGGDEFFAGYPVFKAIFGKGKLLSLFKNSSIREKMILGYFLIFPLLKKENRFFLPSIFSSHELKKVLKQDFYQDKLLEKDPFEEVNKLRQSISNDYERLVLTYLHFYLPALFVVEDKISMAFSMESRTPLCGNKMVDFALSIPLSQKLKDLELKHIPKTAMKNKLPEFLYTLPKRGFPTPLSIWFKKELKTFVREFIWDNYHFIEHMFIKSKVENILLKLQKTRFDTPLNEIPAHKIWMLLNLILYFKNQKNRYQLNAS